MSPPKKTGSADVFETLRDCRKLYLQRLAAFLRDEGFLRPEAIEAIQSGAGSYFDEMVSSTKRSSFEEEVDGLTSSRITLLGEDELELGIRLDNLSNRLFEATSGNLWKLHLRFVTLLNRPYLAKADNPVGPAGISRGLDVMSANEGGITLERKLALLERIEVCLLKNLPTLYAELNHFLDRQGVGSAQPNLVGSQGGQGKSAPAAAETSNALAALQRSLLARLPPGAPADSVNDGATAALLSQTAYEHILYRLNELDKRLRNKIDLPGSESASLEALIPGLFAEQETEAAPKPPALNAETLGISPGTREGLAIDTLSRLFDSLFADPALPDSLKTLLSSLQITLVKVAVQDAGFLTNSAHPARVMIDHFADAMRGLPKEVSPQHTICRQLAGIAEQVRMDFTGDLATFDQAIRQIDALLSTRKIKLEQSAADYLPMVSQLDRQDDAARQTAQILAPILGAPLPRAIRNFFDKDWRVILQNAWLESGLDGAGWREKASTTGDLLWTFAPKPDAADRKALAQRLPGILKQLKSGMETAGISTSAQAEFLDACFSLQTRALRNAPPGEAEPAPERAEDSAPPGYSRVNSESKSGNLRLRIMDYSTPCPAPAKPLPELGEWLTITSSNGAQVLLQLAFVSPQSRRCLLLNPEINLALCIHPAILVQQMRQGTVHIKRPEALFEAAAQRLVAPARTK